MKRDYLIQIEGVMMQDGEEDRVELTTRGSFVRRNGKYFISYEESEATGYEGNITTVKVEAERCVSMLRHGPAPSQLIIERSRRHVCHYESGFGSLSLGVAADEIHNHLSEKGGALTFSYMLDSGQAHISHNQVMIKVREAD